jgi:hypothetical protein
MTLESTQVLFLRISSAKAPILKTSSLKETKPRKTVWVVSVDTGYNHYACVNCCRRLTSEPRLQEYMCKCAQMCKESVLCYIVS